jgi:hypothetical protein
MARTNLTPMPPEPDDNNRYTTEELVVFPLDTEERSYDQVAASNARNGVPLNTQQTPAEHLFN